MSEPLPPMLQADRAYHALGMELVRREVGIAVVRMSIRDDMLNGFAITHGGMVFTLADTAFAVACNTYEDGSERRVTVASGADIVFLQSTRVGQTLTATAVRRTQTGRTGVYDVTVTDEAGEPVAEFRGRSFTTNR